MIILEGPDGAGKTQLAKRLSEVFNWPIADKVVASDLTVLTNIRQWTDNNLETGFQPTIFDRHRLISEPIYSTVIPSRDINLEFWEPEWLVSAYHRLHLVQPLIIWCIPPMDTVVNNVKSDPNNTKIADHIERLYLSYYHLSLTHGYAHSVWYDYTKETPKSWKDLIMNIARHSYQRLEYGDRHQLDHLALHFNG